jgi:hypothetical protein
LVDVIEEVPSVDLSGANLYNFKAWNHEDEIQSDFKLIRDEEIGWQQRMDKLIAAEKKNIYLKQLHLDCMELIDNGI